MKFLHWLKVIFTALRITKNAAEEATGENLNSDGKVGERE